MMRATPNGAPVVSSNPYTKPLSPTGVIFALGIIFAAMFATFLAINDGDEPESARRAEQSEADERAIEEYRQADWRLMRNCERMGYSTRSPECQAARAALRAEHMAR